MTRERCTGKASGNDVSSRDMSFEALVASIHDVHGRLSAHASRAVNISQTVRNWLIGCYIAEYELHGADRADYGDNLLRDLAAKLQGISNCNRRQIAGLYYERSALSRDKKKLAELAQEGAEQSEPHLAIRDPYIFEFLGLKLEEFFHENIGQLNTYVTWYRRHMMTEGDTPPLAFSSAPARTTPWSSTPSPGSTTNSSDPSTNSHCPAKMICSISWSARSPAAPTRKTKPTRANSSARCAPNTA